MPQNLDYTLYFNIVFFSLIGLGFLIGYIRGFKKSLWSLLVVLVFYGLFFLTIESVINQLWTLQIPSLLQYGTSVLPELSNASTIGEAVFIALEKYVGPTLGDTLSNDNFIALITGLSQFALKIVYMIIYFTVGKVLYTIVTFILRIIFVGKVQLPRKVRNQMKKDEKARKKAYKLMNKKERRSFNKISKKNKKKGLDPEGNKIPKPNRRPILGAFLGATKGAVSAFVALIMLGGVMSMTESLLQVLPSSTSPDVQNIEQMYLSTNYVPLTGAGNIDLETGAIVDIPTDMDSYLVEVRNMVTAYNSNLFVTTTSQIVMTDDGYAEPVPLNIYLFDSVLSFNYGTQKVKLRNEIKVLSDAAGIFLGSDYLETNSINDISSEDIIDVFDAIAQSDFITSMIPLAIEVGSDYLDTPVEIPTEELYAIDWKAEISTLGAIVAVGFELVNTAGLLEEDPDLTTVTIEGDDVRGLFDSLADSELVTLGAFVALEPLLATMGDNISAIITVPEDLEWDEEFRAFGEVVGSILDTGISVGDLQGGDPMILISALSTLDFTILLDSKIVSYALRNIFSGEAGIEGMNLIVVPDGVVWFDIYNPDGTVLVTGELRNILLAVNEIAQVADGFDFANIDLNVIADFEDSTIDTLFNSEVLVATISDFVLNMDLGDTPLIIPDSVLDENNYITSLEFKAVAKSARVLVVDLACDEGDTVCAETGFDISKAFTLSDTSIDTLTSSDIIGATVGNLVIDSGGDILVIPNSAMTTISVDGIDQDVVSKEEIKNVFKAVSVLGFTDLENMAFDASIIQNLGLVGDVTTLDTDKSDKLFGSKIVHATLSDMLFAQTEGAESVLAVPYYDVDSNPVRYFDAGDGIDYLSTDELENILQALLTLDITDFADVSSLDLNGIIDNSAELLGSAILHATISKQVFDLGGDIIVVPYQDELGGDIRVTVGDTLLSTDTEYITKDEINNVLDALKILGITDINSFDGTVGLATLMVDNNKDTVLESATIQATISDQLISLDTDGTVNLPYFKEDGVTAVRVVVGPVGKETEYVTKTEISAMLDALDALGISDVESFTGSVNLNTLNANSAVILDSAMIQATVSKQVLDLTTSGGLSASFVVPYLEEDGTTDVRVTVGTVGKETEYITQDEIIAMINGLDILGITDVETFDGSIDLTSFFDETNRNALLESAIMQATISKQLVDLGDASLTIPTKDINNDDIRVTVGLLTESTEYVTKAEISAMFEALEVLQMTDISSFSGTIDLNNVYGTANQDIILSSAAMHATISKQMKDLGPSVLVIPATDVDNTSVQTTVSGVEFINKPEIKAMIDVLELMQIDDITTFGGTFDISLLATDASQNLLLSSASIHATITKTMLDLGDAVIKVPMYTQAGETAGNEVRLTVSGTEFVAKDEIKALINSFTTMGYTDLNSFGASLDSSQFFSGRDVLLLSSSIQATLSDKMINGTSGELVVPDVNVNTTDPVRITQTDVTYIDKTEIEAILDALEELGLTDFAALSFDAANIFTVDFNILFASASIQATVSENILQNAEDETVTAGTVTLIVPTYFREDILIDSVSGKQIELTELIALLDSLDALGADFGGGMSPSTITSMSDAQLDELLASGSVHTTIDNMLRGNANISAVIPDLAKENLAYQTNITTAAEIKAFIKSTQLISTGSIADVSIDLGTIAALSPTDQDTVVNSMIIRNSITPLLESTVASDPFNSYVINNTDYENDNPATFFKKASVLAIINIYSAIL